jgi:hypothetical protein
MGNIGRLPVFSEALDRRRKKKKSGVNEATKIAPKSHQNIGETAKAASHRVS